MGALFLKRAWGVVFQGFRDANGKVWLRQTAAANAVNDLTIANAATGGLPSLSASGSDTNIGIQLKVKGTAHVIADKPLLQGTTATAITTAGNATYTAAQVLGGLIDRDPAGASRTDTLPTAAALVAAIPGAAVGTTAYCDVVNNADAAETITIAAGTGGTLKNVAGNATIPQNSARRLVVRLTNVTASSEAYDLYLI